MSVAKTYFDSLLRALFACKPQTQFKNPVMFVTYVGAIGTTLYGVKEYFNHNLNSFDVQIIIWLWITIFIANLAQAIAEGRGKAQTLFLRKMQKQMGAKLWRDEKVKMIHASELKKGSVIVCEAGDLIPADGEVIEGIAMVDESAITGESAPVLRESGGDRSAVTAGTKVISDQVKIRVTAEVGNSFIDRIIHLVEAAKRQKTPNEISLNIVLSTLTIIFLIVVASLKLFFDFSGSILIGKITDRITLPILIALLVCLIPTTISALLNAIGISGMDRLIKKNVIAKSGSSVEAAGDIDVLLLDKTGTITLGTRMAMEFIPATGIDERELANLAQISSFADETPEGRSIVVLAKNRFDLRAESVDKAQFRFIPFSAETRMSGVDIFDVSGSPIKIIRKGAVDAIVKHVERLGGFFPISLKAAVERISQGGGTPLLVSNDKYIMGAIYLKDVVKGGIKERFSQLRNMGIRTIMVTGDNPLTAAAIAAEAGVDDFLAEATPELKLQKIQAEQQDGHLVAMAGDGTNDAPALAQADVGVAMNTGTQPSREAGNMVDLDSNPTKIIEIVEIGKQLLMTRGSLTTFSMANDIAKYFAIIPAIFGSLYREGYGKGPLADFNIMGLATPKSAILSAVIFNALIILFLIPLALKGVRYKPAPAYQILLKNVFVYGLGGLVAPFIGIKLIDMVIIALGWV